jgi:hypothetical protein
VRAVAQDRAQMRDGGGVFLEQQPHRDHVEFIRVAADPLSDFARESLNAFETDAVEMQFHDVGGRTAANAGVIQDGGESG